MRHDPAELQRLSDDELIRLLPPKRQDPEAIGGDENLLSTQKEALDELWSRHYQALEKNLRAKVFSRGSTLCPREEPDKEHFVRMSLAEAYQAFLRRTRQTEYRNFGGYLYTLLLTVALDLRRHLKGNREHHPNHDMPDQTREREFRAEVAQSDEIEALVSEGKNQLEVVASRELRDMVRLVLDQHAESSQVNSLSVRLVCDRHSDQEPTWEAIAGALLPEGVVSLSIQARIQIVRRKYKHDMLGLLQRLKESGVDNSFAFEL